MPTEGHNRNPKSSVKLKWLRNTSLHLNRRYPLLTNNGGQGDGTERKSARYSSTSTESNSQPLTRASYSSSYTGTPTLSAFTHIDTGAQKQKQ